MADDEAQNNGLIAVVSSFDCRSFVGSLWFSCILYRVIMIGCTRVVPPFTQKASLKLSLAQNIFSESSVVVMGLAQNQYTARKLSRYLGALLSHADTLRDRFP